ACILLAATSLSAPGAGPTTRPVSLSTELYNATPYRIPGSLRATMVYTQWLYPDGADRSRDPDPFFLARQSRVWPGGVLTVLDYEPPAPSDFLSHVDWDARSTPGTVAANIARYARIAQKVHTLRPDLKISFFGATIIDDYDYGQGEATDIRRTRSNSTNTKALKPIADQCDFITIPVYRDTRETDAGYDAHTKRRLLLGRAWGKKVIAVLCPDPEGRSIPVATFVSDVQWSTRFADAVMIWQGNGRGNKPAWIKPLVAALIRPE
ncbi:MAG TPA: hypothetical protein VN541_14235, partial [Tepidisphaeraceae bacterium]|nr:hypothetical protein [Tepidisphaeraceae bacterium]